MYNVAERLRSTITRGPTQEVKVRIPSLKWVVHTPRYIEYSSDGLLFFIQEYINTIEELRQALQFFERSSPLNAEVPALKQLIDQGQNLLLQHFEVNFLRTTYDNGV